MSALSRIEKAGFKVFMDGDNLAINPASNLNQSQRDFLKSHKAEIIAELKIIKVICWTPAGNPLEVVARDEDHAEQLRKWNPEPTNNPRPH